MRTKHYVTQNCIQKNTNGKEYLKFKLENVEQPNKFKQLIDELEYSKR